MWLQTANETLCFQPSARMDAEAEEHVCLPTPVSVPQDLLDPAVRQVNQNPSPAAQLPFFFKNSFLLFPLHILTLPSNFIHIVNEQLQSNILLDFKKLRFPVIMSTGTTSGQILKIKQVLSNGFKRLTL